jgi:membrane protease YdiL (CAAX protease family)
MNHLESVTSKNNQWYWYLLVLLLCLIASNTIGAIPQMIVVVVPALKTGDISVLQKMNFSAAGIDNNIIVAVAMFAFVVLLFAAILFIKIFHNRTWKQVINGTNSVRWSRFLMGIAVWGVISLIGFAISYFTEPEILTFRFDAVKFTILVLITLLLMPFQTTAEEFMFRGYLMQGVASWTKSRWWALFVTGVLFGLLHGMNPEIMEYGFWTMMSQYISMGLMFGIITLLDDGIELAMGVHFINNFLGVTLTTYKGSALQTDALFAVNEMNPSEGLIALIIGGAIMIAFFAWKYKWNFGVMNQKVVLREKICLPEDSMMQRDAEKKF